MNQVANNLYPILFKPNRKTLVWGTEDWTVSAVVGSESVVDNGLWYPEKMFFEDNAMGPLWLLYCNHFEKLDETLYRRVRQ